jgi:hypothetical protein
MCLLDKAFCRVESSGPLEAQLPCCLCVRACSVKTTSDFGNSLILEGCFRRWAYRSVCLCDPAFWSRDICDDCSESMTTDWFAGLSQFGCSLICCSYGRSGPVRIGPAVRAIFGPFRYGPDEEGKESVRSGPVWLVGMAYWSGYRNCDIGSVITVCIRDLSINFWTPDMYRVIQKKNAAPNIVPYLFDGESNFSETMQISTTHDDTQVFKFLARSVQNSERTKLFRNPYSKSRRPEVVWLIQKKR